MTATILNLNAFRKQAELKVESAKDSRVWDRVIRTQDILTSGGFVTDTARLDAWNNAAESLLQYMDNEWPIEKENPCRADQIAEFAAILYVRGIYSSETSKKALELQSITIGALETPALITSRFKYGAMVQNLIDATFAPVSTRQTSI